MIKGNILMILTMEKVILLLTIVESYIKSLLIASYN